MQSKLLLAICAMLLLGGNSALCQNNQQQRWQFQRWQVPGSQQNTQQRQRQNSPFLFGAPGLSNTAYGVYRPYTQPGYYTVNTPTANYVFWKAPSGYYYPWYHYPVGYVPPYGWGVPTIYIDGTLQPQKPSLGTVFDDLTKFMNEAKKEGKLTDSEFTQLNRRLTDLMSKEVMLRTSEGGTLSEGSDHIMRNDLDILTRDISFRLKS